MEHGAWSMGEWVKFKPNLRIICAICGPFNQSFLAANFADYRKLNDCSHCLPAALTSMYNVESPLRSELLIANCLLPIYFFGNWIAKVVPSPILEVLTNILPL